MTRFARASGSKGSNEKRPEDPTSWQEMKTAMITTTKTGKKKKNTEDEPQEQEPEDATSWQDMKTTMSSTRPNEEKNDSEEDVAVPSTEEIQNVWAQLVGESDKKTKKKSGVKNSSTEKKKLKKDEAITSTEKKKKKPNDIQPTHKKKRTAEENDDQEIRVKKKVKISKPEPSLNDTPILEKTEKKLLDKAAVVPEKKEKKRRKEALKPAELMINGKPVNVAPFDGFIVQAEDAARLKELRKSMKSKGIPEEERERAIKLERRRAEKALARLRKKVCFHCRSTGHNLSECPLIESDQRATGICYKCGSTEHTHFQCKVTRGDDFKFAECFICKEQGHIAKQCPDNPRGLYPRGGGCATCGDVTHLKKDCPKYLAEKEDDVTVNTRNDRSLEALEEDLQVKNCAPFRGKKLNKRIKF